MRSLRFVLISALASLVLLGAASLAAAQTQVVETRIDGMTVDLLGEGSTLDPGDVTEGFILGGICWEAGGFNPLGGEFILKASLEGSAPAWLDVRLVGGNEVGLTPPRGPELVEGCLGFDEFGLRVTARDDAPFDTRATLTFAIDVTTEGETGTYQVPNPASASGSITTSSDPDKGIALPDPDAKPPVAEPVEESPVVPVVFVVLVALAATRLARRRA